jgi:hypothetical protein
MSKKSRKRVFGDHKQIGKRFIPPLLQIGKFETVRWQLPVLPELLWLALLNATHGIRIGAELALAPALAASRIIPHKWFAPASAYSSLSDPQKMEVLEILKQGGKAEPIQRALNNLLWFYPNCPLAFLFPAGPTAPDDAKTALKDFKSILADLYYRVERAPMMMQANAIYIAFLTGILKVAPQVSLANFPEIEKYPDTPESERVGSGVRAGVNGFFGHSYDKSSMWPTYFWNRGLELEPCNFGAIDEASIVK